MQKAKSPELLDGNCCKKSPTNPALDLILLVFAGTLEVREEGNSK